MLIQIWGGSAKVEPLSFGVGADWFSKKREPSSSKGVTLSSTASKSSNQYYHVQPHQMTVVWRNF